MMMEKGSGFAEVEHTADWALKVWAADLPELFSLSASGMAWLMEVLLLPESRTTRELKLEGVDHESLLVAFLAELLYQMESEQLGFDHCDVEINDFKLHAVIQCAPVREQKKEIKAVTYHNLEIRQSEAGYSVIIVFDV